MRVRVIVLLLTLPVCLSWPLLAARYLHVDFPVGQPASPDPRPMLTNAVADLRFGNYSFSAIYADGRTKGVVHLPSRSAYVQRATIQPGSAPVIATTRLDGPYRYQSTTATRLAPAGPGGPLTVQPLTHKRWQRAVLARLAPGRDPDINLDNPDVTGATDLIAGVRSAKLVSGRVFGTLDMSGLRRPLATFDRAQVAALGSTPVEYEVSFDGAGRLARIVLKVPETPAAPAARWILTVANYGQSLPQKPPSRKNTQDVPEDFYTEHNS